jgi:hypothetical protein
MDIDECKCCGVEFTVAHMKVKLVLVAGCLLTPGEEAGLEQNFLLSPRSPEDGPQNVVI